MIQTIAIYGIVLFFCFVLARNAQKYKKKGYIVAIVLLLTLLAGLRKDSVGIDTHTYAQYLNLIRNGQFNYVWGVEYTFKMIMLLFGKVFKGYTAFLLSMALITNACIISRLWNFRNVTRFEWTVLVYYIMFYFYGFNIMRQMCAVAIVFWSSRYIEKGKYLSFFAGVAIACLFHTSAILGSCFLFEEFANWRYLDKWKRRILQVSLFIFPIGIIYAIRLLSDYSRYFVSSKMQVGAMLFAKLLFFLISQYGLRASIVHCEVKDSPACDGKMTDKLNYIIRFIEIYYFIGLLIAFVGYANQTVFRVSLYFYILECVYMGTIMRYKKIKTIYPILVALLYSYLFLGTAFAGGQGQVPYLFFWQ